MSCHLREAFRVPQGESDSRSGFQAVPYIKVLPQSRIEPRFSRQKSCLFLAEPNHAEVPFSVPDSVCELQGWKTWKLQKLLEGQDVASV